MSVPKVNARLSLNVNCESFQTCLHENLETNLLFQDNEANLVIEAQMLPRDRHRRRRHR